MKKSLVTAFFTILFFSFSYGQDSLRWSIESEVFPIYSGRQSDLGDGLSVEIQQWLSETASFGLSYSKLTFDHAKARNLALMFYRSSEPGKRIQTNLGFGLFVRRWSDEATDLSDTVQLDQTPYTVGYSLAFGITGQVNKRLSLSTRVTFSNNMDSRISYSLRPGIIVNF